MVTLTLRLTRFPTNDLTLLPDAHLFVSTFPESNVKKFFYIFALLILLNLNVQVTQPL